MRSLKALFIGLSLASGILAAAVSHAEDTREACRGDAIKLCPSEVTNRDRPATRRCIHEHYKELSERCLSAIKAQKEAKQAAPKGA